MTAPPGNRLNPKKLLMTKRSAVTPRDNERHFVVVRVMEPELLAVGVDRVALEAVHSKRKQMLHWRGLAGASRWRQGWIWEDGPFKHP